MTLAVLIKNQVMTWPLAHLSLTKNPLCCCQLGKENKTEICQLLISCLLPLRKIGHQFSPAMKRRWWELPSCVQKQQEKQPFLQICLTPRLQTLWQQLIPVHLRLNLFCISLLLSVRYRQNHPLIFMHTCLILPPLVSFLQHYVVSLNGTIITQQKPESETWELCSSCFIQPPISSLISSSVNFISQIHSRL